MVSAASKASAPGQLRRADYDAFDFIIGMDTANIRNMNWILGGDPDGKVLKLLEFAGTNRSVDDPWYTGDLNHLCRRVRWLRGAAGVFGDVVSPRDERASALFL